ncbi:MAG: ABC transporter substrate-binding protein, partial [Clostridia bacterium]|nr:ABC transporter substrate-binding protein [Clostridia bacterium]
DYGIVGAAVAEKAIPYCNLEYIDGQEMKAAVSGYLKVLYDADPASVGGTLPDNGFYYGK